MPELPDVLLYRSHLERLLVGRALRKITILSPFVMQTVKPSIQEASGRTVTGVSRIGKRIVWRIGGPAAEAGVEAPTIPANRVVSGADDLFIVFHLMIAGRFHLKKPGTAVPRKNTLAAFEIESGILLLTEASSHKRATIHVVRGDAELEPFDRGGLNVLKADLDSFRERLQLENHTLKRALSDPDLFDGIGNAYSDEILHRARLSPMKLTRRVSEPEIESLFNAVRDTLHFWIEKLRRDSGDRFPEKVTAFRPEMAVHGRFGEPCPDCGSPVQRIVYAENECNYCARCQTGGKLLADRALSRLLRRDWPRSLDDAAFVRRKP